MPYPATWTLVPVTWELYGHDGEGCSGEVHFTADPIVAANGKTFVPEPIVATVTDGVMAAVSVPATDDPDISPNGWTWRVRAAVTPKGPKPFRITVPAATVGSLNLATVVPVESVTPMTAVALADSALEALVKDDDSATAEALSARYARVSDGDGAPLSGQQVRIVVDSFGDIDDIVVEEV